MTTRRIMQVAIDRETDIIVARQRARELADALGFNRQDQTRIATAVSEVARNAYDYAGGGSVEFAVAGAARQEVFEIQVSDSGPGIPNLNEVLQARHKSASGMGLGLRGAGRLVDHLDVETLPGRGTTVILRKMLPGGSAGIESAELQKMADRLTGSGEQDLLQELRRQNRDLLLNLDLVRSQQERLQALNRELEETNRGMVALYAELEEKSEQLRRADELKSNFLSNMSHEIRTPLNGIIGYTERLLDEDLTSEQRRFAERIQAAGTMLLSIVDDILDLSKIEAGRVEFDEQPLSVEALIDTSISIISGAAEEKGLSVRLDLDPSLPEAIVGDETRLRQVLLNLLNNAVKFTHEGHITLSARSEKGSGEAEVLCFQVTDTGIGISADKRNRLFQRFSQVDRTVHREFGGTGLGLAISKRLIELMGGEIGFESEEGRGSTFWIKVALPRARLEEITAPEESVPVPAVSARILVAEDLEINQDIARSILERAGHDVHIVADGAQAVASVRAGEYDLILMDIQMPVMDGVSAAREIRALAAPAGDVPIIAMTANILPQQIKSFKQAGINDHIGKPMKRLDLLKKVGEWLPRSATAQDASGEAEPSVAVFDRNTFDQFRELVGTDRVSDWIARLDEQLQVAFEETSQCSMDRDGLARVSHALVSQAGSLGFVQLARSCSALEDGCLGGGDISRLFEQARTAARRARQILATLAD